MEHLTDCDQSIVFLSETWLKTNKNHVTTLLRTYGYILLHDRRKDRNKELGGGGVSILLKLGICYKRINYIVFYSFEHIVVKISLKHNKSLILVSIYKVLFIFVSIFLEEITQLFEILI